MRSLLATVTLYMLFLVQTNLSPWGPDLVLLALVVFSLHETRLTAALLGLFGGLCLDLTAPSFAGAHAFVLAALGYTSAYLRDMFYRSNWSVTLLALVGLAAKWLMLTLSGSGLPALPPLLTSLLLTLLLSPVAALVLTGVFYRQWKSA